jgi:hypothetical protein
MSLDRAWTMRDDNAPHQIRITCPGGGGCPLRASCTCGKQLGVITTAEQALGRWHAHADRLLIAGGAS